MNEDEEVFTDYLFDEISIQSPVKINGEVEAVFLRHHEFWSPEFRDKFIEEYTSDAAHWAFQKSWSSLHDILKIKKPVCTEIILKAAAQHKAGHLLVDFKANNIKMILDGKENFEYYLQANKHTLSTDNKLRFALYLGLYYGKISIDFAEPFPALSERDLLDLLLLSQNRNLEINISNINTTDEGIKLYSDLLFFLGDSRVIWRKHMDYDYDVHDFLCQISSYYKRLFGEFIIVDFLTDSIEVSIGKKPNKKLTFDSFHFGNPKEKKFKILNVFNSWQKIHKIDLVLKVEEAHLPLLTDKQSFLKRSNTSIMICMKSPNGLFEHYKNLYKCFSKAAPVLQRVAKSFESSTPGSNLLGISVFQINFDDLRKIPNDKFVVYFFKKHEKRIIERHENRFMRIREGIYETNELPLYFYLQTLSYDAFLNIFNKWKIKKASVIIYVDFSSCGFKKFPEEDAKNIVGALLKSFDECKKIMIRGMLVAEAKYKIFTLTDFNSLKIDFTNLSNKSFEHVASFLKILGALNIKNIKIMFPQNDRKLTEMEKANLYNFLDFFENSHFILKFKNAPSIQLSNLWPKLIDCRNFEIFIGDAIILEYHSKSDCLQIHLTDILEYNNFICGLLKNVENRKQIYIPFEKFIVLEASEKLKENIKQLLLLNEDAEFYIGWENERASIITRKNGRRILKLDCKNLKRNYFLYRLIKDANIEMDFIKLQNFEDFASSNKTLEIQELNFLNSFVKNLNKSSIANEVSTIIMHYDSLEKVQAQEIQLNAKTMYFSFCYPRGEIDLIDDPFEELIMHFEPSYINVSIDNISKYFALCKFFCSKRGRLKFTSINVDFSLAPYYFEEVPNLLHKVIDAHVNRSVKQLNMLICPTTFNTIEYSFKIEYFENNEKLKIKFAGFSCEEKSIRFRFQYFESPEILRNIPIISLDASQLSRKHYIHMEYFMNIMNMSTLMESLTPNSLIKLKLMIPEFEAFIPKVLKNQNLINCAELFIKNKILTKDFNSVKSYICNLPHLTSLGIGSLWHTNINQNSFNYIINILVRKRRSFINVAHVFKKFLSSHIKRKNILREIFELYIPERT